MPRLPRIPLLHRVSSWRTLIVGAVIGAVGILVLAVVVLPPWLLNHRSNLPGEVGFGHFAVSIAATLHSHGAKMTPLTAGSEELRRGEYAYVGSCAMCHGPNGDGKNAALTGALFPPAPDLTSASAKSLSDAQLFWITKNGLSFTAMPGFAAQYNDEVISAIVAYLRTLQDHTASSAMAVPTPTGIQLAKANVAGDTVAQGAAVYFAQGCQLCHGAAGDAPGEFRLREVSSSDASLACTIRNGPNGMPAYDTSILSDAQLTNLEAYLHSLAGAQGGGGGEFRRPPDSGTPAPGAAPERRFRDGGGDRGGGAGRYSSQAAMSASFTGCGR